MILSIHAQSCFVERIVLPKDYTTRKYSPQEQKLWPRRNNWKDILKLLELTDIILIFIVTNEQISATKQLESEAFKKYLQHKSPKLTNPNYKDNPRRLTLYIFKGTGEPYEI